MPTKLQKLLDDIHPRQTRELTAARGDLALATFPHRTAQISGWTDFKNYLIEYAVYAQSVILNARELLPVHRELDWHKVLKAFQDEYGVNGERAAFEIARTGKEGGLYAVLKTVTHYLVKDFHRTEVRARVQSFWDRLSIAQKTAVVDEYLATTAISCQTKEILEGSAARVRVDFPKTLEKHVELLEQLMQVGRYARGSKPRPQGVKRHA